MPRGARTLNLGDLRAIARRSRGMRGLGDGVCYDTFSNAPIDCTTGAYLGTLPDGSPVGGTPAAVPCLAGSGPLQAGQSYCAPASTTTATIGPYCFSGFAFPWLGNTISGGGSASVCSPVFNVPSPWGTFITVGLLALVATKVLGGRR